MDLPSGVFRQQHQRWAPNNIIPSENRRLVAFNNCEHSYNNLGFTTNATNAPSSSLSLSSPSNSNSSHPANYLKLNHINQYKQAEGNNNRNNDNNNNNKFHIGNQPTSPATTTTTKNKISSNNHHTNNHQKQRVQPAKQCSNLVSIKSKIGVEYRRYAVLRNDIVKFDDFFNKVEKIHQLQGTSFVIYYSDQDGEFLPINNDDNLAKAIDATARLKSIHYIVSINNNTHFIQNSFQQQVTVERPFLKLFLEKKGIPNELYYLSDFTLKCKRKDNLINLLMPSSANSSSDSRPRISMPEDFRQVSSIIDADILPATRRRVVLKRGGSDKPLGFYIRDGTYHRMNSQGVVEKNYGIFISRLVPGGLAESTNLLAENDEILEVNGIEVGKNKRLDQVRDMMVANSSNLIITTRPAKPFNNQYNANYNRLRAARNMTNYIGRDRLPSSQSTSSDLGEDFVRHHMN